MRVKLIETQVVEGPGGAKRFMRAPGFFNVSDALGDRLIESRHAYAVGPGDEVVPWPEPEPEPEEPIAIAEPELELIEEEENGTD